MPWEGACVARRRVRYLSLPWNRRFEGRVSVRDKGALDCVGRAGAGIRADAAIHKLHPGVRRLGGLLPLLFTADSERGLDRPGPVSDVHSARPAQRDALPRRLGVPPVLPGRTRLRRLDDDPGRPVWGRFGAAERRQLRPLQRRLAGQRCADLPRPGPAAGARPGRLDRPEQLERRQPSYRSLCLQHDLPLQLLADSSQRQSRCQPERHHNLHGKGWAQQPDCELVRVPVLPGHGRGRQCGGRVHGH